MRADLPFVPAGINDSGAIVGTINNTAVRYLNGTLTTLPAPPGRVVVAAASFLPPPLFHPAYAAVAIANTGHIVGDDGSMLLWNKPNAGAAGDERRRRDRFAECHQRRRHGGGNR